jgi:hypothetical protein
MSDNKPIDREFVARTFCYESGVFDTPAEIKANLEHQIVKAAYRAADKIMTKLESMTNKPDCHADG